MTKQSHACLSRRAWLSACSQLLAPAPNAAAESNPASIANVTSALDALNSTLYASEASYHLHECSGVPTRHPAGWWVPDGAIYGMTSVGGQYGNGVIYRFDRTHISTESCIPSVRWMRTERMRTEPRRAWH